MEFRNRYLVLYLGSVAIAILAGFIFRNIGISLLLLLVLRLAVNIWYAQKLHVSIFIQLFVGIFSTLGLVYLLGYHPTLSPVSKLLQNLLGFYEKNFKKIFVACLSLMGVTIAVVFVTSYLLFLVKAYGYNQATTNLALFILFIVTVLISGAVLLIALLWFYAALLYILEPLITNEPAPTIKEVMRKSWSKLPALVGTAGLKAVYVLGPIALILLGFILYINSATFSLSIGNLRNGLFSTYSVLNVFYYLTAIAIYVYMLYMAVRLTFGNFGVLFSNTSVLDSLRQSFWLTKGLWWAVAWRLFATHLVIASVIAVTVGSFAYLTNFDGIIALLGYLGQIILYMFFFPLLFSVPLYIYYEIRNLRLGK